MSKTPESSPIVAVRLLRELQLDDEVLFPVGKIINLGINEATLLCLHEVAERVEPEQAS